MAWTTTVATLIAVGIALYFVVRYMMSGGAVGEPQQVTIVGPISDARETITFRGSIPRSLNEKEGLTFSYAAWILVDDWMYRQGEALRNIFVKGTSDSTSQCPGLYLDGTSNAMILKMDTYGDTASIQIPNLPAKKWIHVTVVTDQTKVQVYIDGILRIQQTLRNLPRQNSGPVYVATEGGWAGQIGSLEYFRRALTQNEISNLVSTPPYEDATKARVPLPPYLDDSWYLGRY